MCGFGFKCRTLIRFFFNMYGYSHFRMCGFGFKCKALIRFFSNIYGYSHFKICGFGFKCKALIIFFKIYVAALILERVGFLAKIVAANC